MPGVVGTLYIKARMSAAGIKAGSAESKRHLAKLRLELRDSSRAFKRLGREVKSFAKTFSLIGVGAGFALKKVINFGDEIAKTSKALDVSTQTMAQWRLSAELAGVEVARLTDVATKMYVRAGRAALIGKGQVAQFAEAIGMDPRVFKGMSGSEVMNTIVQGLADIEDASQRAGAANILGASNTAKALLQLAGSWDTARETFRKYNIEIGDIQNLQRLQDQLTIFGRVLQYKILNYVEKNSEALIDFMDNVLEKLPGMLEAIGNAAGFVERHWGKMALAFGAVKAVGIGKAVAGVVGAVGGTAAAVGAAGVVGAAGAVGGIVHTRNKLKEDAARRQANDVVDLPGGQVFKFDPLLGENVAVSGKAKSSAAAATPAETSQEEQARADARKKRLEELNALVAQFTDTTMSDLNEKAEVLRKGMNDGLFGGEDGERYQVAEDALGAINAKIAELNKGTLTVKQQLGKDLQQAVTNLGVSLQRVASDQIAGALVGETTNFKSAIQSVGKAILSEIVGALIKATIEAIGLKAILASITGGIGGFFGFSKGGFVGKNAGGFASDGGAIGPRDVVPAMLAPREFVIPESATARLGAPVLRELQRGRLPASGGGSMTINLSISPGLITDPAGVGEMVVQQLEGPLQSRLLDAVGEADRNRSFASGIERGRSRA